MADETPPGPNSDSATAESQQPPSQWLQDLPSSYAAAHGADVAELNAYGANGGPHTRQINPRSCVTCRRRKVKCDKTHPCANCSRARIECVYPSPGRAPRKPRKPGDGRDKELLERLRRLEGVVKGLGVNDPTGDILGSETGNSSSPGSSFATKPDNDRAGTGDGRLASDSTESNTKAQQTSDPQSKTHFSEHRTVGHLENRFGRLVINEGKSRYINNSFWANLSAEVEDLKGVLNQSSDDEDTEYIPGPNGHSAATHQGWIFGFSSASVDLLSLHPLPHQVAFYWEVYKSRVDPLIKCLHVPTAEVEILNASSHLANLSKGLETLLFAVYYGATTSLTPEECQNSLGEAKGVLLSRYRFALEQALSRANFLVSEEMVVLQGFVVFLVCLRRNNDARVIWTLTGLVVRIAQTMGIHRDGSHFDLKPFEIEMRRRLWWSICILDSRASEDHGCDPTIIESAFDTKMPLNINDSDISPSSTELPPERVGCTDMSFCLIRFEVTSTFRRLNYVPPKLNQNCQTQIANVTLQDKEQWITECHARIEGKYLQHCDMSVPIYWVTATVARLMMSKMWLMLYHPFQRQDGGASLPKETHEKLFITSLENIEYSLLLETEARTMKWGWLFKTYMQWHAVAFLLSALCKRTTGDLVDRAWIAVDKTRDGRWSEHINEETRAGHLWRPLKKLYRKAKEARQRGLRDEALAKQAAAAQVQQGWGPNAMAGMNANPARALSPSESMDDSLNEDQRRKLSGGPVFGQVPLDSHVLLKSPILESGNNAQMDASSVTQLPPEKLNSASGIQSFVPGNFNNQAQFTGNLTQPEVDRYPAAPVPPGGAFNPDGGSTVGDTSSGSTEGMMGFMPATSSTIDLTASPNDLELSQIMDTSGDLNWQNWDQLVRQFGMEIDYSPNSNGGVAADWGGGHWNVLDSGVPGGMVNTGNGNNARDGGGGGGGMPPGPGRAGLDNSNGVVPPGRRMDWF